MDNFIFENFLYFFWSAADFQIFFTVVADIIISNEVYKYYFCTDWYKLFISHQTYSLYLIYHPEFVIFWKQGLDLVTQNTSEAYFTIFDVSTVVTWITPTMQFIDMTFILYGSLLLFVFYFSYFNNTPTENNSIDSSYLSAWVLIESEKEVGSIDDILLTIFLVVSIFAWFFAVYVWSFFGQYPELLLSFYSLPFLIYLILGVPTLLILDFGGCFLVYLRGGSANQLFLAELIYDYINFGAFYVRLCLQLVRLLLMLLTFAGMSDIFLFDHSLLNSSITSLSELFLMSSSFDFSLSALFYIICDSFPRIFARFVFEIGHTLTVCSIQFGAFFAIVFWFFLFLYTFFCAVKLEMYFYDKRALRKVNK